VQVVFCGTGWLSAVEVIRRHLPDGVTIRIRDPHRPITEEIRDADVILPSNARIDSAAIAAAERLRLIQQPAAGYEGIDLEAAKRRGIPVCNAPAINADAVAQCALLLMLSLARKVPEARRAFAERRIGVPIGIELNGRVLGLIGRGRTARRLRAIAEGIGMEVIDIGSTSPRAEFEALLTRADFVSVHCPLTPKTRGMLGEAELARMKRGAYLINCARGAIVDRGALEKALDAGQLAGVGLDVHWAEPWEPDSALYRRPDVISLPHVAGSTEETFTRLAQLVAGNIERLRRGEELLHRIA
jgi:phosphoglycerate dehydrogenase-like enzyme